VPDASATPSARQVELLEAAYAYVLAHGLSDVSLRPLAAAICSSPRVLLFLFGTKDDLVRALLARARQDELGRLGTVDPGTRSLGLNVAVARTWAWLADPENRPVLRLWTEAYARSLVEPDGAWADFARTTVGDWLAVLASYQPAGERDSAAGLARRTLALAVLRGALLDLLATGDADRVGAAVRAHLDPSG
jgi:AcrR family transcriptional regulator